MSRQLYHCCDENRRSAVDAHPTLNGIDFLEVLDGDAPPGSPPKQTLLVRMLKPAPVGLSADNVAIIGGERIVDPAVEWVGLADAPPVALTNQAERDYLTALPSPESILVVRTEVAGDFSTYCLRLQIGALDKSPPPSIDPRLAQVDFSFRVECPSDFDCAPSRDCPEEAEQPIDIDYLVRDYAGFRRLMLDRLSQQIPAWRNRSAADLGVTLTEAVAYLADQYAYWQDAVASEAYLETARKRASLRRHALMVDYRIGEGRTARTWIHVEVEGSAVPLDAETAKFFTTVGGVSAQFAPGSRDHTRVLDARALVFEPILDALFFEAHNAIAFYTWGDERCCLPAGATQATLQEHFPDLAVGDLLIFEEVMGPLTGEAEDADPAHRHAVRLTEVEATSDPLTDQEITQIAWHEEDALPFALCLSAVTDADHGSTYLENVSLARGNVLLADFGDTRAPEDLGSVADSGLVYPPAKSAERCQPETPDPVPPRFRPKLAEGPVTQAPRSEVARAPSASASLAADEEVFPQIWLDSQEAGLTERWVARNDLLNSNASERHFVVETETDLSASLRFGDDRHGRRPEVGTGFAATYRVGNGLAGNVGQEAISHLLIDDTRILSVRNPLAASGGKDPETAAQIRRRAPQAFRTQERAVTPEDYAAVTERHPEVQRAAATPRWTGSWHTMFVTVDQESGRSLSAEEEAELVTHVEPFRMAGHDLEFNDPSFVSLELDLRVCVERSYFRADVKQALLEVLSSARRADGQLGIFHPDNFSFGQTFYLSPVYAAARSVPGVDSVEITLFQRQGEPDPKPLADEFLSFGRLEIPRLANNPNFPEHGVLRLEMVGGK
ncbi:MAG: putative baseplate assembly protein [Kiloniellales bacterium]